MTKYEVRQFLKSVSRGFMSTVFESPSERVARSTYDDLKINHPDEYFELVEINSEEKCLAFSPNKR